MLPNPTSDSLSDLPTDNLRALDQGRRDENLRRLDKRQELSDKRFAEQRAAIVRDSDARAVETDDELRQRLYDNGVTEYWRNERLQYTGRSGVKGSTRIDARHELAYRILKYMYRNWYRAGSPAEGIPAPVSKLMKLFKKSRRTVLEALALLRECGSVESDHNGSVARLYRFTKLAETVKKYAEGRLTRVPGP